MHLCLQQYSYKSGCLFLDEDAKGCEYVSLSMFVRSLTCLQSNDAIRQLPFLGKQTVPTSLRKDIWQPLATILFPHPPRGLQAYHKLREYRKLHELEYPLDDFRAEGNKHDLMEKKKRGRKLMDQKANSIADIAAVLIRQDEVSKAVASAALVGAQNEAEETSGDSAGRKEEQRNPPRPKGSSPRVGEKLKAIGAEGVTIRWRNVLDAEYAESWPAGVLHDELEYTRHTADLPTIQLGRQTKAAAV